MRLEVNNATVKVTNASSSDLLAVYSCVTYRHREFIRGKWHEETRSMFNRKTKVFLTGLLPHVIYGLRARNMPFSVSDQRHKSKPYHWPVSLAGFQLRDYQSDAVEAFLKAKRGIIQAGTGAGKTIASAAVIRACQVPTIFLVHRTHLLYQTAERFVQAMPEAKNAIGIVGDGSKELRPITLATVQTMDSMIKRLGKRVTGELGMFNLLIVDEAHRATSNQFENVTKLLVNCDYRLGLSATPFMTDKESDSLALIGLFGKVVYKITASELVKRGVLARPFFRWYDVTEPRIPNLKRWRDVYEKLIVNNEHRNRMIAGNTVELVRMRRKTLVIASEIKHIEILDRMLREQGLDVGVATGNASSQERARTLKRLEIGHHDCILCSTIFDEGVDLPDIGGVVLAAGNKSAPALLQRTGRAIRAKEKENYAVIVDYYDRTHPMLQRHSEKRMDIVRSEPEFRIVE